MTSIQFPQGWLTAALRADRMLGHGTLLPAAGLVPDLRTAWQAFIRIQERQLPLITQGRRRYEILDLERRRDGVLFFARNQEAAALPELWRIFFQDKPGVGEIAPLSTKDIRKYLLEPYRDPDVWVGRDEITWPEISEGPVMGNHGERLRQELRCQNGHRIELQWIEDIRPSQRSRQEIWQASPNIAFKALSRFPLGVLTQVDEVRLRSAKASLAHNEFHFQMGRRVIDLVPHEVNDETALSGRLSLSQQAKSFPASFIRHFSFLYQLSHELMGHGLASNRFIRREIVKIVASGERPPTPYALRSLNEWFSEGAAELWTMMVYESDGLEEWKQKYPALAGLLLHALGCLEETVEPVNPNMARWLALMRRMPEILPDPSL